MEKELKLIGEQRGAGLDDIMKKYYLNRKNYHRVKILKDKYLEN
jgi:hypothetical protein